MVGIWKFTYDDGRVKEGEFKEGIKHGFWTISNSDGSKEEGIYKNG